MPNADFPSSKSMPQTMGPGSPRDVPPPPGQFPIDPATLPQPIQDELLVPDPVAIDTSAEELKDGLNRCPKCGATDIRHKPGTDLLICLYCRNEWHGERVEDAFELGLGIDQLRGTVIASGAQNIALDVASLAAISAGDAGAVHPGCALLQSRLACAQGLDRQHGFAGGDRHECRLGPVGVAVAQRARWQHAASLF